MDQQSFLFCGFWCTELVEASVEIKGNLISLFLKWNKKCSIYWPLLNYEALQDSFRQILYFSSFIFLWGSPVIVDEWYLHIWMGHTVMQSCMYGNAGVLLVRRDASLLAASWSFNPRTGGRDRLSQLSRTYLFQNGN